MKTLAFINYKGGVGKSTTTYHIGCSLALDHGMKVLLVDIDPQTNLTFLCATPEQWESFKDTNGTLSSLYRAYLDGQSFDLERIVWKEPITRAGQTAVPGLDIIPSDVELLGIDLDLMLKTPQFSDLTSAAHHYVNQRSILYNALQQVKKQYDYVLIDCPPNLYLVTQNALSTSDYYVVTALPDHLSTIGLSILEERVNKLNNDLSHASAIVNQRLAASKLGGIIFVRVRMGGTAITGVHSRKIAELSRRYRGKVFENYTTEGIGYSEAAEVALPVFLVPGSNPRRVAEQYREITAELIRRIPT